MSEFVGAVGMGIGLGTGCGLVAIVYTRLIDRNARILRARRREIRRHQQAAE